MMDVIYYSIVLYESLKNNEKNPMGSENLAKNTTPSIPNYKSFQESWRVKQSQSLTKIIERSINICDIK